MNKYKQLIEDYEERHSGICYTNGAYAQALNIRVGKHKITADIKLVKQFEGVTERYNDCEYPITLFKEVDL